jgi:hypothetical protein
MDSFFGCKRSSFLHQGQPMSNSTENQTYFLRIPFLDRLFSHGAVEVPCVFLPEFFPRNMSVVGGKNSG